MQTYLPSNSKYIFENWNYKMDTGQGWAYCPPLANAETTPLWEVSRSELAVEIFFPKLYGKSKQRYTSETINLFLYCLLNKQCLFFDGIIDIRDEPARPCPTRPGTDAL